MNLVVYSTEKRCNIPRSKVTVLPFTSAKVGEEGISPAVLYVPASPKNGLATDSLLVCVDLMTFHKSRLVEQVGELETELLKQAQAIVKPCLDL